MYMQVSAGDRAMMWLGSVPKDILPKDAQGREVMIEKYQ
jgi:hypothetical protein